MSDNTPILEQSRAGEPTTGASLDTQSIKVKSSTFEYRVFRNDALFMRRKKQHDYSGGRTAQRCGLVSKMLQSLKLKKADLRYEKGAPVL